MPRIGYLSGAYKHSEVQRQTVDAFREGMRERGYVEGRDYVLEDRYTEGQPGRYRELADELVRSNVDVIVLATGAAAPAVQQATAYGPEYAKIHRRAALFVERGASHRVNSCCFVETAIANHLSETELAILKAHLRSLLGNPNAHLATRLMVRRKSRRANDRRTM